MCSRACVKVKGKITQCHHAGPSFKGLNVATKHKKTDSTMLPPAGTSLISLKENGKKTQTFFSSPDTNPLACALATVYL